MSDELLDAIQTNDVDRVADLLASGVNPNVHLATRSGLTPLQIAIGQIDLDNETEPAGPFDVVVLLLRYGADVNGRDKDGHYTPIFAATQGNRILTVRLLLALGADPNVMDDQGYTPLRFCARQGYLDMARLLLRCGAKNTIDGWGGEAMTALGHAASNLHVDMVKLLLANGADPQARNVDEMTALECMEYIASPKDPAAQERLREIRALLSEPKANV